MSADGGSAAEPADRAEEAADPLSGLRRAGEVTALPVVPRRHVAPATQAVFIHSSWRTSSTWFWLKFREKFSTLCYCEPFNEALGALTREQAQSMGPKSWWNGESRHPPDGGPYFLEFRPLIRRAGGVRLFPPEIAYDWFVPAGGIAGDLRPQELRYVGLLSRHAARREKVPVFGFTRSLGRLSALKRHFGGIHIFLYRNLWTQWASYVSQSETGNRYFLEKILRVMLNAQDRFFAAALNRHVLRAVERGLPAPSGDADVAARLLDTLSEAELFGLFMALHGYLYIAARLSADLSIDATRLARDPHYRETAEARIFAATGLAIDLADVKDVAQSHWVAPDGIDWQAIREDLDFACLALDHLYSREELARGREQLIDETLVEMQTSERYLARPRAAIARLERERAAALAEREALGADLDRLAGEHAAALAERAAIAQTRDAALAERDEVAQHRNVLSIDRDELARTLHLCRDERDAALAARDEVVRALRDRQQERDAAAAERDALRTRCDRLAGERGALATAAAGLASARDAAVADCERLARDRAALVAELSRLSQECDSAAMQRDAALAELDRLRRRRPAARLRRLAHRLLSG